MKNREEDDMRYRIKVALENMYMFGGMPKPDPNYDRCINNMIEYIMKIEIPLEKNNKKTKKDK